MEDEDEQFTNEEDRKEHWCQGKGCRRMLVPKRRRTEEDADKGGQRQTLVLRRRRMGLPMTTRISQLQR